MSTYTCVCVRAAQSRSWTHKDNPSGRARRLLKTPGGTGTCCRTLCPPKEVKRGQHSFWRRHSSWRFLQREGSGPCDHFRAFHSFGANAENCPNPGPPEPTTLSIDIYIYTYVYLHVSTSFRSTHEYTGHEYTPKIARIWKLLISAIHSSIDAS